MDTPTPPVAKRPKHLGLNRAVKAWLSVRPPGARVFAVHPSEVARLCPVLHHYAAEAHADLGSGVAARAAAAYAFLLTLRDNGGVTGFHTSPELEMEFTVGDQIHTDVQYFLGAIGYLWGEWECAACGVTTEPGRMPRVESLVEGAPVAEPAPCPRCRGANLRTRLPWRYLEPRVRHVEWDVDGHCDGVVVLPGGDPAKAADRIALEIKSINEAGFQGKIADLPKPEHVVQANLYAAPELLDCEQILLVYVNKNQINKWKEILLPRSEQALRVSRSRIAAVDHGRKTSAPPLHARACVDINDPRAAKCPAVERCYGRRPTPTFFSPTETKPITAVPEGAP